jgi:hypothetical protein
VKKLAHFIKKKRICCVSPVEKVSVDEVAELKLRAVLFCRKQKIERRLIDSTDLPKCHLREVADNTTWPNELALDAASAVHRERIDFAEFRVQIAKNRGLDAEIFHSEAATLELLLKTARK